MRALLPLLRVETAARVLLAAPLAMGAAFLVDGGVEALVGAAVGAAAVSLADLGRDVRRWSAVLVAAGLVPAGLLAGALVGRWPVATAVGLGLLLAFVVLVSPAGVLSALAGLFTMVAFLAGASLADQAGADAVLVLAGGTLGAAVALGLSLLNDLLPRFRALELPPDVVAAALAGRARPGEALRAWRDLSEETTVIALVTGVVAALAWLAAGWIDADKRVWVALPAIAALAPVQVEAHRRARAYLAANAAGILIVGALAVSGLEAWAAALVVVGMLAAGVLVLLVHQDLSRALMIPFSVTAAAGSLGLGDAVTSRLVDVVAGLALGLVGAALLAAALGRREPGP